MRRVVWMVWAGLLASACGSDGKKLPPFEHGHFYDELQQLVGDFTLREGDWLEDFGDGAFYGLAFYAQAGETQGSQAYRDLAVELRDRNLRIITEESLVTGDVNEIAMSALGFIEYVDATGDRSRLADLDELIANISDLVATFGHYLPAEAVPGYAMETYGPTSINGLMTLIALQRAQVLGGTGIEDMVAFSENVAGQIEEHAWNGTFYEFNDGVTRPGLFLYPNITMIILNARLFQLTGKDKYLQRALGTYAGMQPLKVTASSGLAAPGRYRSPYSAETMGAQTDDYSTFSSQNYTMFALMLLYQITGEEAYLLEMNPILDFLQNHLVGEWCLSHFHRDPCDPVCEQDQACILEGCEPDACHQAVLHHLMDGRVAQPQDPEYICSGCNLQLLYLMWYRQHRVELVQ